MDEQSHETGADDEYDAEDDHRPRILSGPIVAADQGIVPWDEL